MSLPSHVKPFVYAVAAAVGIGLVSSVAGIVGVVKDANQYDRDLTMRDAAAIYEREQSAKMDWPGFAAPEKRYPAIQARVERECPYIGSNARAMVSEITAKVPYTAAVDKYSTITAAGKILNVDPVHLKYVLQIVAENYQANTFKKDSDQIENYAYQLCDVNHYKERGFTE